jgi:hypothetical protein
MLPYLSQAKPKTTKRKYQCNNFREKAQELHKQIEKILPGKAISVVAEHFEICL